ncbi:MAG: hypothetical protein KC619_32035 [Myxococcales bacterium]|nr:hypothetical protein [Myxococcales bacterium]
MKANSTGWRSDSRELMGASSVVPRRLPIAMLVRTAPARSLLLPTVLWLMGACGSSAATSNEEVPLASAPTVPSLESRVVESRVVESRVVEPPSVEAPVVEAPIADPPEPPACEPVPLDHRGLRRSPSRVYAAAGRYFREHTAPGSGHELGPELESQRRGLVFDNTYRRETGAIVQPSIDEIATRYPDSLVTPHVGLQSDSCYDEVFLDLTEDGRYVVIVETDTARPVFMYRQAYQP